MIQYLLKLSRQGALIFVLVSVALIQQLPIVKDLAYSEIRILVYFLMLILIFRIPLSTIVYMKIPKVLQIYFLTMVFIIIQLFVFRIIGGSIQLDSFSEPLVSLGILYASYSFVQKGAEIDKIVSVYILLSTILSLSTALYYGPGIFIIPDRYFVAFKSGPTYAAMYASILSFGRILKNIKNKSIDRKTRIINESFYLIIIVLNFLAIIAIKSRSALIGTAIGIIILMFFFFKPTIKTILLLTVILIVILLTNLTGFTPIRDIFEETILSGFDRSSADSILTGRLSLSQNAILFISNNLSFGEMLGEKWYFNSRPHNYFLNKFVSLGLIGSIPFVFLYSILAIYCIHNLIRLREQRILDSKDIGIVLLAVSFLLSTIEYTLPFGPGATQMIVWLLVGQYLRRQTNKVQRAG